MPITFKVTDAGRAALVNAANTGTLPVTVAQVGVTATGFTAAADGSDTALPGELKRLATFGGAAVADDTIHAVIRDDSADVYTLRGFALYLVDGTLFGLYGQADPILEKSAGAMMLLATDVIFADIDAASLVFGDTSFLNPPATVDTAGVVELATDAETVAGVDAVRAVTPKGLLAKLTALLGAGAPSAFVKTLLTAVDLVAFRTLLSIKTAASYDIGVGNGLDADLLDGQHGHYYRAWGNLTDVPSSFTPSAHQHSAADITSGTLAVARGGTGAGSFTAGSYLVGNGAGAFGIKTPAQVLADIGAAPVVHSHEISAVNGLSDALAARPLQTSVTAQITAAVNALLDGTPGALDTLNELAAALGDDANFAATVTNALAQKAALAGNNTFSGDNSFTAPPLMNTPNDSGTNIAVRFGPNDANKQLSLTVANGQMRWNYEGSAWYGSGSMAWSYGGAVKMTLDKNGGLTVVGALNCLTMNATGSDIRLKTDVRPAEPRPLHRLLAELPDTHGPLTHYTHRVDGAERRGPIAQDVERVDPSYTGTMELAAGQVRGIARGTYKTVDKAGMAYEQSMWAGQEIDRLHGIIAALCERVAALEQR
ncbi:MAG: hypothetical protein ACTHJ9_10325 [Rhodanobacter sp.]